MIFHNFLGQKAIALTTERKMDFSQDRHNPFLNDFQRTYLQNESGLNFPKEITIRQVHGENIVCADDISIYQVQEADGIMTNCPGIPAVIRTADCLPVFLFDQQLHAMGLIHCGWRSSQKAILKKAVTLMGEHYHSAPQDIKAVFGPCIRPCCYEVDGSFREIFPDSTQERDGRIYFDLAKENHAQLVDAGILLENISDGGICTCCREEFFSYRREGEKAGRMLSLIMVEF